MQNHCRRGKAIRVTYSESVSVVLVIQHTKRMRCIFICGQKGSNIVFFSTLSHKRYDLTIFGKIKVSEHKMCGLIFSTNFVLNISNSRKNSV